MRVKMRGTTTEVEKERRQVKLKGEAMEVKTWTTLVRELAKNCLLNMKQANCEKRVVTGEGAKLHTTKKLERGAVLYRILPPYYQ